MLQSFTRNYHDNSTEAGFQFTFYCDQCQDGYRSSFVECETYKKGKGLRSLASGAYTLGSMIGGRASTLGWGAERGADILSDRFNGRSPEWQKEHETAFEHAQNEAMAHFHRCHACQRYVCDGCFNDAEGMCVHCAPLQEVYVAKARSEAIRHNIDEKALSAEIWQGKLESTTTECPTCGHPAGAGKFCNNCGASLALAACPSCGAANAQAVRFCSQCGSSMEAQAVTLCRSCGTQLADGARFCGSCGTPAE